MALIRYPGNKTKLAKHLFEIVSKHLSPGDVYCEPFLGVGSLAIEFMRNRQDLIYVLGDADKEMSSFWKTVLKRSDDLCRLILDFTPSVDAFQYYKNREIDNLSDLDLGFGKLVLHQLSWGGLGRKAGPLGGFQQKSQYKIDCRWNTRKMIEKITECNKLMNSVSGGVVVSGDYRRTTQTANRLGRTVMYLDPPYYKEGGGLYELGFKDKDHVDLASFLLDLKLTWFLSYDDCPEIRVLYDGIAVNEIPVWYNNSKKKMREVLFYASCDG